MKIIKTPIVFNGKVLSIYRWSTRHGLLYWTASNPWTKPVGADRMIYWICCWYNYSWCATSHARSNTNSVLENCAIYLAIHSIWLMIYCSSAYHCRRRTCPRVQELSARIRWSTPSVIHPQTHLVLLYLIGDVICFQELSIFVIGELVPVVLVHRIRPQHVAQRSLHFWLGKTVDIGNVWQLFYLSCWREGSHDQSHRATEKKPEGIYFEQKVQISHTLDALTPFFMA